MEIQVNKGHYDFQQYVNIPRWCSYYYQIKEVLELSPRNVLVIGVGDGIVVDILKGKGLTVYTFDLDKELRPDYCGSVSDFSKIVKELKVDIILCCQVLEHLPYEAFLPVSAMLSKHCNVLILSLPYASFQLFKFSFKFERVRMRTIDIRFPRFYQNNVYSGEHYWEIGYKGYPMSKIENTLKENFEIKKGFFVPENTYHYFFKLLPRV